MGRANANATRKILMLRKWRKIKIMIYLYDVIAYFSCLTLMEAILFLFVGGFGRGENAKHRT
jgi:hypothetical protein